MPATQTLINHGAISTQTAAFTALRLARDTAGYGAPVLQTTGTDYADTYAFTNGTGTFATTYLQFNSSTSGQYQRYQQYTGLSTGTLTGASAGLSNPAVGFNETRYTIRQGNNYRSLIYKPSTGTAYKAVIYQLFDTTISSWKTVVGEILINPQNKPTAFNENLAASTLLLYYDAFITRYINNFPQAFFNAYRWMYPRTPYTGWAGSTSGAAATSYDNSALLSRACTGPSGHQPFTGDGNYNDSQRGGDGLENVDYIGKSILPFTLGVWDLTGDSSAKLAQPFILTHRMRPIGTAGSDFCIGPILEAGFEVTVSPTEKYWSLGASLFVRQA